MRIEHKLQIDAIKGERIYYSEFGEWILLSDGKIGVYLKGNELKIDKNKMHAMGNVEKLDPDYLMSGSIMLNQTKTAHKTHLGYAIKLKNSEDNVHIFVLEKYLNMFYGYSGIAFKTLRNPILITKYDQPYGIICPITINEEIE